MADLIEQGARFLSDMRAMHMSRDVTYAPVSGGSVTVVASIGRTVFEVEGATGILQRTESRDYVVSADAVGCDPMRGDLITEQVGESRMVYEVSAPPGEPVWRWGDAHRTCRRVHTRYLRTEMDD